jgi:recombination protein RecT
VSNIVPVFQTPAATSGWLAKLKPQMMLALPKHMNVERMARLVLTAFSGNSKLAECSPHSVAASIMTASQLGLEPNVNGQGYLIPYKGTCTFVPGWKGLVDLANRGGRCTVWTGAVYRGDEFDYSLGDNPFVRHKPGDEAVESFDSLQYVYAIGRIKGQDVPVIEVWRKAKVMRHLELFNKVGEKHYALKDNMLNFEMYARKVPLLQVLKYMPQSIELTAAMEASRAAEAGRTINIDGATWVTTENPPEPGQDDQGSNGEQGDTPKTFPDAEFAKNIDGWKALITNKKKTADQIIAMAQTKRPLTESQKAVIRSVKPAADADGVIVMTYAQVAEKLNAAKDKDKRDEAATLIDTVQDEGQRKELRALYERRTAEAQ